MRLPLFLCPEADDLYNLYRRSDPKMEFTIFLSAEGPKRLQTIPFSIILEEVRGW